MRSIRVCPYYLCVCVCMGFLSVCVCLVSMCASYRLINTIEQFCGGEIAVKVVVVVTRIHIFGKQMNEIMRMFFP